MNTLVTSDFRQEIEISEVRACALKNMKYSHNLWQNRRNSREIPVYLSFYTSVNSSSLVIDGTTGKINVTSTQLGLLKEYM